MKTLTSHQLVALLVRLFAVALAINLIQTVGVLLAEYTSWQIREAGFYLISPLIAQAVLIVLLWLFPTIVARSLIPPANVDLSHADLLESRAYSVGFVLLGFCLLFYAISDAAYWYGMWVFSELEDLRYVGSVFTYSDKAAMVATGIEVVLALYLVFGAEQLASIFRRLRRA
jgi:hypothetical protein